jgi:hypothetical protein
VIVDSMSDELIPLAQVAKFLPPGLKHLHASTAARWALRGVGNPRVRIETLKIGGRRYVTRAAVDRFVARLTGGEAVAAAASAVRQSEHQRAEREMDEEGI